MMFGLKLAGIELVVESMTYAVDAYSVLVKSKVLQDKDVGQDLNGTGKSHDSRQNSR